MRLILHKIDFKIFRDTLDVVKQSAALCLLRLFRTDPNIIPSGEWTSRIIHLLNDQHMGVVTAVSDKCIIIVYFLDFLLFTSQL